ncbi:MAG: single-stranded DNA-binding protein [Candidatus Andersenbacteria bacterium]|nr:single-stranded DNA-binding protein [bacterium]MDZ4225286.1 single-stranded DNA-binding protein [Candidatus Andersenbacteria bacterium]
MDLNKAMIIGRLTRDPETRTTPQGITVANFSVATNRVWKDNQGNQRDATEYHNIVAWRRLGEICAQYLAKGRQVYIEGHLQTRSWEGQDGKKNYRTEIVADNMIMLGNRSDNAGSAPAKPTYSAVPPAQVNMDQPTPTPANVSAPAAPASDEEIRIEDIPF